METYPVYCGGEFIQSKKKLLVTEKFTGEPFAETWHADKHILDRALDAAEKAKPACGNLSSLEKSAALRFIYEEIKKKKEELARLLCRESGKPVIYAAAEIER